MIGLIWTVLIGFMAYTQWLLIKKTALDKFRSSDGWDAGINGSIAITTLGTGKDFSIENIKEPIIAFAFSHKGLMGNITLEGTKITKIQK
jgi:lipid-binding SYLF domain-containing protein